MSLPKFVFVTEESDERDGTKWLNANTNRPELVEDDGEVHTVGTYQLIKKLRFRKTAVLETVTRK